MLVIGEWRVCKQELHNLHDPFAVAVYNGCIHRRPCFSAYFCFVLHFAW